MPSLQRLKLTREPSPLLTSFVSELDKKFGTNEAYARYQHDPIAFCTEIFHEEYTDDVKKLMMSIVDHETTVAISANATGKTHCAARIAVWWYKSFVGAQVYTAAAPPEGNLKRLLWGEIGSIVTRHKNVFIFDSITNLNIQRNDQEFIVGVTIPTSGTLESREAKFSGKHAPHILFILDEGDAIPDDVYRGIESCMSGGQARLLVMFNPRKKQGAAYRMIRDRQANVVRLTAFTHPNVITGRDIIPGAVTRDKTVKRINMWCRPAGKNEIDDNLTFELPKFLIGCTHRDYPQPLCAGKYRIVQPVFSYMVLGEYPAQGSMQLISEEWINAARARYDAYVAMRGDVSPVGVRPVMGLDVAEYGDDSNVACFRYGGFLPQLVAWNGIDIMRTIDRAVELYVQRGASICKVDALGVGSGVSPGMVRKRCLAVPIKVSERPTLACTSLSDEQKEFGLLRDQLWWSVREWLRADAGSMLPPDEQLIEELLCPEYWEDVLTGKIKVSNKDSMKEVLRRSPDRAEALILSFAPAGSAGRYDYE